MTERRRISHLLRRLGVGATRLERAECERLGVAATVDRLIDYRKRPEGFPVSPWEFCHDEGTAETYLDPFRTAFWWSLRMMMSQRPLEQRLTLFWHDHFAVGGDKVEFGPSMLAYLEAIRTHATDRFPALLSAVTQTAAMARYLDLDASFKGQPNENFARELLELFTTGPGAYTERDIQETARAFTGYGIRYLVFEAGDKVQERAKEYIGKGLPLIAFTFSPDLHDPGVKRVLGEEGRFRCEELLDRLAARPETARHICSKLWRQFGTPDPVPKVVDRLAQTFKKSEGRIDVVLRDLVETPEFWASERRLIKSPFDFLLPILRQFEMQSILVTLHGNPKSPMTPVAKPLRDTAGLIYGTMARMGMTPLFPPNVGGWEGGEAWLTPDNMLARIGFADVIFGVNQPDAPLAAYLAGQILSRKPADDAAVVADFLETFDADLPASKVKIVDEAFKNAGGLMSLAKAPTAAKSLSAMGRLVFGSPEFQLY